MFNDSSRVNTTVVVTTVGVVLAAAVATTWWQKKRRMREHQMPTKWRYVGELAELCMYPLKSGAVMRLNEAECTEIGIQTTNDGLKLRDRFFIVITEDGIMKTARQHPKLFFIKVSPVDSGTVTFKAPDMQDLTLKIPSGTPKKKNYFKMWLKEEVESVDCGDEAALWIGSYLGLKESERARLGFYQEGVTARRDFDKEPWNLFQKFYTRLMRYDGGAFSDMASYLLINEASVKDLNERIATGKIVQPVCFRPNFVIRGPKPLDEDKWNFIKIGESAVFQNFKPCLRCVVTTMNPETAKRDPEMQPLKTLRKYRLLTDPKLKGLEGELSPAMGLYLGLRKAGLVKVGDPVYVGKS